MRSKLFFLIVVGLMVIVLSSPVALMANNDSRHRVVSLPFQTDAAITIDGDPSDWGTAPTLSDNSWTIYNGQFVWKDATGDERTDFANPDPRVDITEFRITGDSQYIYFLIEFNNLDQVGSDGSPGIMITIDTDHVQGSGQTYFGYNSDTQVAQDGNADWEYQVLIDLSNSAVTDGGVVTGDGTPVWSGGSPLDVVDTSWSDVSDSNSEFAASTTYNAVEVRIPWSTIGITDPANVILRIELADVRVSPSGDAWDISGVSDVLDCMTTTGPNTWDEVQDGYVDYYVDIQFGSTGEPVPEPLYVPAIIAVTVAALGVFILYSKNKLTLRI